MVGQSTDRRSSQPASTGKRVDGTGRCCRNTLQNREGRQATYSIRKRHIYQVLRFSSRKIGKGQDGLGTVGDMVGGRRVSRNINPPV